jgi:hypothetical protein
VARPTTTLNPLHFEDLEPKRFEDLCRQVAYNFRDWSQLEATGRAGSDGSFDARGWEVFEYEAAADGDEEPARTQRVWLIQCKREPQIGPKKMSDYAQDILKSAGGLYGVLFIAPANLSFAARNTFRTKLIDGGVTDVHLWGKGELEDRLFRPENDSLLYAYFGISLLTRRRTKRTYLRSKLATKKRLVSVLGPVDQDFYQEVLLRDSEDTTYPHKEEGFDLRPRWRAVYCAGHYWDGLLIQTRRSLAYIDDSGKKWDTVDGHDTSRPFNPWEEEKHSRFDDGVDPDMWAVWDELPDANKAWFELEGAIPYDNVLAVDEHGDHMYAHPHLYIETGPNGRFTTGAANRVEGIERFSPKVIHNVREKDPNRIDYFAKALKARKSSNKRKKSRP